MEFFLYSLIQKKNAAEAYRILVNEHGDNDIWNTTCRYLIRSLNDINFDL